MKISMGLRLKFVQKLLSFIHDVFPISVLVIEIFCILQGVPGPRGQKGERGPSGQQVRLYFVSRLWIYYVGSILRISKFGYCLSALKVLLISLLTLSENNFCSQD